MNYINYFQAGGQTQATGEENAQIMFAVLDTLGIDQKTATAKLDQIAQSGDKETMNMIGKAIQIIIDTQQNPTEQTQQAAQFLQETLGSQMFKQGGKLNSLVERFKKGGVSCKCGCGIKKGQEGIESEKCGGKAKKKLACGSKVKKGQEGLSTEQYNKALNYAKNHMTSGDIRKLQIFLSGIGPKTGGGSTRTGVPVGSGYYKGNIDGIIGPETIKAIAQYQRDNGLVSDGMWGSRTNAKHDVLQRTWGAGESTPIDIVNQRRDYVPIKSIVTSETNIEPAVVTAPTTSTEIQPAVVTARKPRKFNRWANATNYMSWLMSQPRVRRSEGGSKIESAGKGTETKKPIYEELPGYRESVTFGDNEIRLQRDPWGENIGSTLADSTFFKNGTAVYRHYNEDGTHNTTYVINNDTNSNLNAEQAFDKIKTQYNFWKNLSK